MKKFGLLISLVVIILACQKGVEKQIEDLFGFQKPVNFPAPVYKLAQNPVTKDGFELGRALFYEPMLSGDNTISCGTCHIQSAAFTHHGHDLSHGIEDRLGKRNSQPIQNMAWNTTFMWDGGIFDLDLQPIAPIENSVEMGHTLGGALQKLRGSSKYPGLFQRAFGSTEITSARMLQALSQFMVMMISADSKYDKVKRGEGVSFTPAEQEGYTIFQAKCGTCHQEPLFTDQSFRNNGLAVRPQDLGRWEVTAQEGDKYRFKVPSLRNVMLTPPYMHDGRILNIDGVLDHYTSDVQNTQNLDPLFRNGSALGIALSANERTKIKAFLATLTDDAFIQDKRFAEQ
ncbi:cytochrome-c peroxidase [Flavisolibacter sp. BT320]|nr:cytochrome-c peroxidase [Flavisolibacter longurius]